MAILTRRFERLQSVLNCRMGDLTVVLEDIQKPHNISAILRTCDAIGLLEAHTIYNKQKTPTFNSTAQGSQKWVNVKDHKNIEEAINLLKGKGFNIFGTNLRIPAKDYRDCDYTKPTAFVLGAEKWGLSKESSSLMDQSIFIPMRGMVQSLNVSVAAATLLFEALRQRHLAGLIPKKGEGMDADLYQKTLFEWAYPEVANWCKKEGRVYPSINSKGEIIESLPRNVKMRY